MSEIKSSKDYNTILQIAEIEKGKYLLNAIVNMEQLKVLYKIFEPLSREWRGQYQALAKAIVEAYDSLEKK